MKITDTYWDAAVNVKDLENYRSPTQSEIDAILKYATHALMECRLFDRFIDISLGIWSVLFLLTFICSIFISTSVFELFVFLAITCLFWLLFYCSHKTLGDYRTLKRHLKSGDYLVLDCVSAGFFSYLESNKEAVVKIQTMDGVLCEQVYSVDLDTALVVLDGKQKSLLLMYEPETNQSRVFTYNMLYGKS